MRQYLVCLALLGGLACGCASTVGPHAAPPSEPIADEAISFPPSQGPKRKIHVVQLYIPIEDVKRYPELAEKRVGFGLSNILVETLFDTGRFVFLEEKEQILKRLVELWELTEDGILVKVSTAAETALQAPEFLVYAEVFDFVACSPIEKLGPVHKNLSCVTSVGVQVRIAKTATGEYIPGSTDPLSSQGKYVHTISLPAFARAGLPFDQSAVGKAHLKASRYAMLHALQRFDRARW